MKEYQKIQLCGNKDYLLHCFKEENLVLFINWLDQKNAFNENDVSLEEYIKRIYTNVEEKDSLKVIELMYKELLERQDLKIQDIEFLGKGVYTNVYGIGDYIIKFGKNRRTPVIPYNRRILQPVIRQNINGKTDDENTEDKKYINSYYADNSKAKCEFVEIQNKVDTKWNEDMDIAQVFDVLYEIYKELRNDGIVWTDIKEQNVGRLIKKNTTNYIDNGAELDPVERAIGMTNKRKEEPLGPGEYVIIDTDYIYPINEIDIDEDLEKEDSQIGIRYLEFEKAYRKELENKRKVSKEDR